LPTYLRLQHTIKARCAGTNRHSAGMQARRSIQMHWGPSINEEQFICDENGFGDKIVSTQNNQTMDIF
jgi:hypothetical protein